MYELELKNLAWAKGREEAPLSLRNAFDRDTLSQHFLARKKVVPFLQIERFHWSPTAVGTAASLLITFLVLKPVSSPAMRKKLKAHCYGKSHIKSKPISCPCLCESWLFKDQGLVKLCYQCPALICEQKGDGGEELVVLFFQGPDRLAI